MTSIGDILGPGGALARSISGYEARPSQLEMAEQVADALATRRPLLVEAGTGTGKTLAYLVPAVLSGLKVVISTGTKNLQEQIFRKDIPLLQQELSFSAACMKGISNYLCLRRFSEYSADAAVQQKSDATLDAIRAWARVTESGDRAELPDLPDDAPLWREVSSTPETRLGAACPHFERCHVTQARRRAQQAEIIIVNHHLFFADLSLRAAWPNAQLLPKYEAVIFDEAHQLEDVATDYFGVGVSTLRLAALVRDLDRAIEHGNAPHKLDATSVHVASCAEILFAELRARLKRDEKSPMHGELWRGPPEKAAHQLDNALDELEAALEGAPTHDLGDQGDAAEALAQRARSIRNDLALLVDGAQKHDRKHVFWAETRGKTVLLHASPVDVSNIVREHVLGAVDAAIFTSATLTAAGSFEFVRARLGLDAAMESRLASPFDFAAQAMLYLPRDLPAPADEDFAARAAERMLELVQITDGRAFLLFTSHRQLERVHRLLAPRLSQPVLMQGEKPKHLLVEEFKRRVGSVLFATASFWEGVDVVGEALSLVVIDKLPFQPPDDPIVAARAARLEEEGQDPFTTYQVPRAALALAQGFGRLIRHRGDRGIVALLDRRAVTKSYGRRVLAGLPADCPRTDSLDDLRTFWAKS